MVNVIFCRDLIDETDAPSNYQTPCRPFTLDQLIKMMIIYELHGFNDIAVDTAERFAELLGSRFDVIAPFDFSRIRIADREEQGTKSCASTFTISSIPRVGA
jgi:hypothetical protein